MTTAVCGPHHGPSRMARRQDRGPWNTWLARKDPQVAGTSTATSDAPRPGLRRSHRAGLELDGEPRQVARRHDGGAHRQQDRREPKRSKAHEPDPPADDDPRVK